jgi:hypothetical protein
MESMHMSPKQHARLIMEAVALLHQRGFGRLKLFCYVKEGLGAWRHGLFASDTFPESIRDLPEPNATGSLPGMAVANGDSPEEVADDIVSKHPELANAALGSDHVYVEWYGRMIAEHPQGVLEMESPREAVIAGVRVEQPLIRRRPSAGEPS